MILVECEQGSPEWHEARAGSITASMFKVVRDTLKSGPNKGGYKEAAKNYAFRLAIERISGQPLDEGFETYAMRRGHELEPDARLTHSLEIGREIERAGFVMTDDGKFGASADGLFEPNDGSEYKCLIAPDGIRDIILDGDLSEYMDQIQGCLWLTGRKRWHFGLYCPALAPVGRELTLFPVDRDDDYIEAMEKDLVAFDQLVESYREQLGGSLLADSGSDAPASEPEPEAEAPTAAGMFD